METLKWLAPLVISLIALGVSITTMWQNFFSSFRAEVRLGNLMWKIEELQYPTGARTKSLVMVAEIHHVNAGARSGQAAPYDVLLTRNEDMKNWQFQPNVFVTYGEFIRRLRESRDKQDLDRVIEKAVEGPFTPVFLQGKQSLTRAVVFAPPSGFPVSVDDVKRGNYVIRFREGRTEGRAMQTTDHQVGQDEIAVLKSGKGLVVSTHR